MNWYIKVIKNYFNVKGRAQRAEYWYFILINGIISIILQGIDVSLGYKRDTGLLSGIYGLFIIIPLIAVSVRRLHDIGKTGWWLIVPWVITIPVSFIPIVLLKLNLNVPLNFPIINGIVLLVSFVYVYIILMTKDSVDKNKYGPNPKLEDKTSNCANDINHIKSEIKILVAQGYTNEEISEKLATKNVSKEEVIKISESIFDVMSSK